MLFTVLCQDQLPVTGTQILRGPHEEDLSSSTALPLLLSLLYTTSRGTTNLCLLDQTLQTLLILGKMEQLNVTSYDDVKTTSKSACLQCTSEQALTVLEGLVLD